MTEVEQKTQEQEVKNEALAVVEQAKAITITDDITYRHGGDFLLAVKTAIKKIKDPNSFFEKMRVKTYEAYQAALSERGKFLDPLEEAEKHIKGQMESYTLKAEQEQEEMRSKLNASARIDSDEAALEAAYAAEAAGAPALANAILSQEPHVPAVVLPPAAPAMRGISTRKSYDVSITNLRALIVAVAAGSKSVKALLPNMSFLKSEANQQQEFFNYPGVKTIPKRIIAGRAKK